MSSIPKIPTHFETIHELYGFLEDYAKKYLNPICKTETSELYNNRDTAYYLNFRMNLPKCNQEQFGVQAAFICDYNDESYWCTFRLSTMQIVNFKCAYMHQVIRCLNAVITFALGESVYDDMIDTINQQSSTQHYNFENSRVDPKYIEPLQVVSHFIINYYNKFGDKIIRKLTPNTWYYIFDNRRPMMLGRYDDQDDFFRFGIVGTTILYNSDYSYSQERFSEAMKDLQLISNIFSTYTPEEIDSLTDDELDTMIGILKI